MEIRICDYLLNILFAYNLRSRINFFSIIFSPSFFLNIYLDVAVEVFSTVAPTKRKQLDASYAMAVSRLESDVVCS